MKCSLNACNRRSKNGSVHDKVDRLKPIRSTDLKLRSAKAERRKSHPPYPWDGFEAELSGDVCPGKCLPVPARSTTDSPYRFHTAPAPTVFLKVTDVASAPAL